MKIFISFCLLFLSIINCKSVVGQGKTLAAMDPTINFGNVMGYGVDFSEHMISSKKIFIGFGLGVHLVKLNDQLTTNFHFYFPLFGSFSYKQTNKKTTSLISIKLGYGFYDVINNNSNAEHGGLYGSLKMEIWLANNKHLNIAPFVGISAGQFNKKIYKTTYIWGSIGIALSILK